VTITLAEDNAIYDRLTALAACLCAQITDPINGVPDVCFCGIVPGESVPADYAGNCNKKCGMAWVRLTSIYPANIVGAAIVEPGNCDYGIGMDVEMGILRCISVGSADGASPSPAELLAATQLQIADALVMQKALVCCDAIPPKDVILGVYQSIGPEGGLVGGSFPMSMGVI
jgi:hypothetical protein